MAFGDPIEREVTVSVKKSEQSSYKDKLVEVDRQIDTVAADKASEMADFNQRLKDLRKQRATLLDTIENGTEVQRIRGFERLNERLGQVEFVREDNGKVIHEFTRPATAEERQTDLFGRASTETAGDGADAEAPAEQAPKGRRRRSRAAGGNGDSEPPTGRRRRSRKAASEGAEAAAE